MLLVGAANDGVWHVSSRRTDRSSRLSKVSQESLVFAVPGVGVCLHEMLWVFQSVLRSDVSWSKI